MRVFAKSLFASLMCASASLALAQQPVDVDIVQVYGQFVQGSYAASRCLKPDQDTLQRFLANFNVVAVTFTEEVKKRSPGQSDAQIATKVKQAATAVEQAIDRVIATDGCDDPRIQELLARFETQADMKLAPAER